MAIETTTNQMPATPFVGLNPFRTDEAILFFGRRQHTIELLQMLRESHFIAVVGSSGSGKSSLIRAGLIPQLKAGFLVEERDRWHVAVMKPGDAPLKNLAHTLVDSTSVTDVNEMNEAIRNGGAPAIVDRLSSALRAEDANLLLLVDQFEELFRFGIESKQPDKREEAGEFVSLLLELAAQSDLPCFVVMTMRSDFIGDCDNFYGLPEALNRSQFLVPRLTREQRRQAIEGPIRLFKADITPRLLDRVVNDVGDHSDQLPVMQHALMRTWEHWRQSGDTALDLPHYNQIGGSQAALSRDADAALQSLSEDDQALAKRMFQALTDTDARNRRIRRPAHVSELASSTGATEEQVLALIENFKAGGRSFLTLSQDADSIVDISHESLIRQWTTMSDWVHEEAESRDMLLRIADAARSHRKHPSDDNFWRGSQLQMALEWLETRQPNSAWASRYGDDFALANSFLEQSRSTQEKAEAEKESQHKQRLRSTQKFMAGLSLALVIAVGLAIYAWHQQSKAIEQERNARFLTYIANMNLVGDALEQKNYVRVYDLLDRYLPDNSASDDNQFRSFYWYYLWQEAHSELQTLRGHGGPVLSVAWSADGKTLASGSEDDTIKLWDVASGKELRTLSGHGDSVLSVAWSADGKTLASGSEDDTIKLWEVASGKEVRTLNDGAQVWSVAWSADGKTLASGSPDKTIKLWEVASGKEVRTLNDGAPVLSVAWSADGKTLASGSTDKTIKLWDVASGKELRTLTGHGGFVWSVAWSADGKTLASGSEDNTIKLWDVASGNELRTLSGHGEFVWSVAWSADGKTLASGSKDKTIKLWDVASGQELHTLRGHGDDIRSVTWSADGKTLASGSEDNTIKLWEVASGKEVRALSGHGGHVVSVAWSADGKTLASGSEDKTIKLWDVASGKELRTLSGHRDSVWSVAWSADGKTLASGSWDETIKLWDVASGQELRTLSGHGDSVLSVTWSADGKTLASGSSDKTIKLWDVASGKELRTLSGHGETVVSVAWSADGKTLASGSRDETIKLWDVASGKELRTLSGHKGSVMSVAWSADGKTLASGNQDKTIKLWDVASGQELRTLSGHGDSVLSVAWSADGKTLASGSSDKTIKLWDVASGQELRTLQLEPVLVTTLAFSRDGNALASGSFDPEKKQGIIRLWFAASEEDVARQRSK